MSGSGIDEDTMIAFVVVLAALVCAAFAVGRFRAGRPVVGVVWSIGAAVLAFIAWFFATFTIRMF
jgi:steroid 5-alpha reductase family enzyme